MTDEHLHVASGKVSWLLLLKKFDIFLQQYNASHVGSNHEWRALHES